MFALILAALLPAWEMRVVERTALTYRLTPEQRALLVAIRRAENGIAPYFYGVADRRCDTYEKQCAWTANTIRRRYFGDVRAFAWRWLGVGNPNWVVWERNVKHFMRRQNIYK